MTSHRLDRYLREVWRLPEATRAHLVRLYTVNEELCLTALLDTLEGATT